MTKPPDCKFQKLSLGIAAEARQALVDDERDALILRLKLRNPREVALTSYQARENLPRLTR